MYTVCYVATDNGELQIFNELMISVCSLRCRGYSGNIAIVTDQRTSGIFKRDCAREFSEYGMDLITVEVPEQYPPMEASRYLKTTLREHIKGDFLFIDTDTVFARNLPAFISDEELAMVTDRNQKCLVKDEEPYPFCKRCCKRFGMEIELEGLQYFNSGVIWAKDTERVHAFYKKWHEAWLMSLSTGLAMDQPILNYVNWGGDFSIAELDSTFNIQVAWSHVIRFDLIRRGYIIHYMHPRNAYGKYLLTDKKMRNLGYKSEIVQEIIRCPWAGFQEGTLVEYDEEQEELEKTAVFGFVRKLYSKHKKLFSFLEKVTIHLTK